jgi:CHAT domain-containing protein/tetratricopeptide (TPR) repeat protein
MDGDQKDPPIERATDDEIRQLNRELAYFMLHDNLERARLTAERVTELRAAQLPPGAIASGHPSLMFYAESLGNLASVYHSQRRFTKADPLYVETLDMFRRVLPRDDPNVPVASYQLSLWLNNYGAFCADTGRPADATLYLEQALALAQKNKHPDETHYAQCLTNLGVVYAGLGRPKIAKRCLVQAREYSARSLTNYPERLASQDRYWSRNQVQHPCLSEAAYRLAVVCMVEENAAEASQYLEEATAIDDAQISIVTGNASESERLAFLASIRHHWTLAVLHASLFGHRDRDEMIRALSVVLRRKGLGLEVSAALAAAGSSADGVALAEVTAELDEVRNRIANLAWRPIGEGPGLEAHRQKMTRLHEDREQLERRVSRTAGSHLNMRLQGVKVEGVARALSAGDVAIEFVLIDGLRTGWRDDVPRYIAFVLTADQPFGIQMVNLGPASQIDDDIAGLRTLLSDATGEDYRERGRTLRRVLFDRLSVSLEHSKRLFLAPDGELWRLPFGVLPMDDDSHLIDHLEISYVATARDLLHFKGSSGGGAEAPVVIADPAFDLSPVYDENAAIAATPAAARVVPRGGFHFSPLQGTHREGTAIAAALKAPLFTGVKASKQLFRCLASPRILHVATHGFFLPEINETETPSPSAILRPGLENPLLRSGLALAGANLLRPDGASDNQTESGILSAEEVMSLRLSGTELVVLSACETGLGDVRIGEGVFGLQRAFVLAGARSSVMSLWKVPDDETCRLMESFYAAMEAGSARSPGLRQAQLAMKSEHPHPYYWGAFVFQGDPGG